MSASVKDTISFADFTMSLMSILMSAAVIAGFTLMISPVAPACLSCFCMTPGLTVDICGLVFGQMMVAIRLPPNAGRVCLMPVDGSFGSNVEVSSVVFAFANSMYLETFTSRCVQSAVRPVLHLAAIRGAKSRPMCVAP